LALQRAIESLARTTDRNILTFLSQAVETLGERLAAEQAAGAMQQALDAMTRTTDPSTLSALAQAVRTVSGQLALQQAAEAADKPTQLLLAALARTAYSPFLPNSPGTGTVDEQRQVVTGDHMRSLIQALGKQAEPLVLAEAMAKLTERLFPEQAIRAMQTV